MNQHVRDFATRLQTSVNWLFFSLFILLCLYIRSTSAFHHAFPTPPGGDFFTNYPWLYCVFAAIGTAIGLCSLLKMARDCREYRALIAGCRAEIVSTVFSLKRILGYTPGFFMALFTAYLLIECFA
jgi:hypothetical protein